MSGHHRIAVIGLSVTLATLNAAPAQPAAAPRTPAPPPLITANPTPGPTMRPALTVRSRAMLADALAQMVTRFRSPNAMSDASNMRCQAVLLDYALRINDADAELSRSAPIWPGNSTIPRARRTLWRTISNFAPMTTRPSGSSW